MDIGEERVRPGVYDDDGGLEVERSQDEEAPPYPAVGGRKMA